MHTGYENYILLHTITLTSYKDSILQYAVTHTG